MSIQVKGHLKSPLNTILRKMIIKIKIKIE
nr:MAG TPA: hypothetical protein [Caudoviricetes sp.]